MHSSAGMTQGSLSTGAVLDELEASLEYHGTPYWVPVEHPRAGFRGIFPTAAEDFTVPYEEEEDWEWDLIGL